MASFSITRIPLSKGRVVTVKRSETARANEYDTRDISGAVVVDSQAPWKVLSDKLLSLKGVVAVEIVEGDGRGICVEK